MVVDEAGLFITFMTVVVLFVSYLFAPSSSTLQKTFVFSFMYLFCIFVFTVDNLFLLYFFYEASLLPILYIIIK